MAKKTNQPAAQHVGKESGLAAENSGKNKGHANIIPHKFKPGVSGNPGGRPKGVFRQMTERVIQQKLKGDPEQRTKLELMVEGQIRGAVKGNPQCFAVLRDTVDGKPQADKAEAGAPVQVVVLKVEFVGQRSGSGAKPETPG